MMLSFTPLNLNLTRLLLRPLITNLAIESPQLNGNLYNFGVSQTVPHILITGGITKFTELISLSKLLLFPIEPLT